MTIVGLYLNTYIRTGGQRRYIELMEGVAERGHTVFVIMNADFDYEPAFFVRIPISVPAARRPLGLPFSVRFRLGVRAQWNDIRAALNGRPDSAFQVDWVHIHGEMHWLAARLLVRRTGARLFFAFRSNVGVRNHMTVSAGGIGWRQRVSLSLKSYKYRLYERIIGRRADLIAFQSSIDETDFLSHAPNGTGRTVVIPGAIDGPRFRPELRDTNESDRVTRIVYVGLVDETKGISFLLRALADLSTRGDIHPTLDILGRGSRLDEMKDLAHSLGIGSQVEFHGQVADPFPYIVGADLMVYPTLYDAFPDVVLEALHVGLPVIASGVGGVPDILVHDELLFPPMDQVAIADAVHQCITDPVYYRHVRKLCHDRRAQFVFDWPDCWIQAMENA